MDVSSSFYYRTTTLLTVAINVFISAAAKELDIQDITLTNLETVTNSRFHTDQIHKGFQRMVLDEDSDQARPAATLRQGTHTKTSIIRAISF